MLLLRPVLSGGLITEVDRVGASLAADPSRFIGPHEVIGALKWVIVMQPARVKHLFDGIQVGP